MLGNRPILREFLKLTVNVNTRTLLESLFQELPDTFREKNPITFYPNRIANKHKPIIGKFVDSVVTETSSNAFDVDSTFVGFFLLLGFLVHSYSRRISDVSNVTRSICNSTSDSSQLPSPTTSTVWSSVGRSSAEVCLRSSSLSFTCTLFVLSTVDVMFLFDEQFKRFSKENEEP